MSGHPVLDAHSIVKNQAVAHQQATQIHLWHWDVAQMKGSFS